MSAESNALGIGAGVNSPSRSAKMLLLAVVLAPLAWFLGIYFAWFHVVAIAAVAVYLTSPGVSLAPLAVLPAVYAAWYGISIAVNAPGAEPDRVLAAIYNLSYWVMAVALIVVGARTPWRLARDALVKMFVIMSLVLGIIVIIGLVAWHGLGLRDLTLPTLFSLLVPAVKSSVLLSDSTSLILLQSDWLSGSEVPRSVGFSPYPTATAALAMFALPFLVARGPRVRGMGFWIAVALVGCIAGMIMANSRTIWIAVLFGSFLSYATYRRALAPAIFMVIAASFLAAPFATFILDAILDSRAGSSHTRIDLYLLQVDLIVKQSPFLGLGIKERVGQFEIPLGSHSTVLGAFYKTGTVGLALILMMMLTVTIYWFRAMAKVRDREARLFLARLGVPLLGMNFYLLTEDIDAPQLLCFLYFLSQGLMVSVLSDPSARIATRKSSQPQFGMPAASTTATVQGTPVHV